MNKLMTKILAALPVKDEQRAVYVPNFNPTEYPLFSQEAADMCRTARYVGGTSRWLCECADPQACRGVIKAKLLAAGVKYTRKDYMDGLKEFSGMQRHKMYYGQFVTEALMSRVLASISIKEIMQSKDEHLNDIPLRRWDNLGLSGLPVRLLMLANVFTYKEGTKPFGISSSDCVCVNKLAAHLVRDTLSVSVVGTHNFRDEEAALKYYKIYGFNADDVRAKIDFGEIAIGRPVVADPDSQWFSLDADNRYQIHIIE